MRFSFSRWTGLLLGLLFLALSPQAGAGPVFPPLTGRVVDQAGILPADIEAKIETRLKALETQTTRQLVVVTVSSLQGYPIEEFGYQLGRLWGIGDVRRNDGVLLLVAPAEHVVRIEVGYGLEPVLTDALANAILNDDVLPYLRQGQLADGVVSGVDALISHLSLPDAAAKARAEAATRSEAETDVLAMIVGFLVLLWFIAGLVAVLRGRGAGIWLWPLIFILHHGGSGRSDRFGGRGGSFGGGGASGRW